MEAPIDISIIIVNWRVRHLVEKCLDSIRAQESGINLKTIIVDNYSNDGIAEMLMLNYPEVKYTGLIKNYGFAKANNLALGQATGKYICLLNPDTELKPGFLAGVLKYFSANSDVDIIGPRLLNTDGSLQYSVRRLPSLSSQIFTLLKLQNIINPQVDLNGILPKYFLGFGKLLRRLFAKARVSLDYLASDFDYNKEQVVEQLMGAAIICRAEVFKKIGNLDEKFYIWFEEVDFCKRAQEAGLVIKYVPELEVIHHGGQSFAQAPNLRKQLIFDRSLIYYFWKHNPKWQAIILVLLTPINLFLTLIYVWLAKNKK